MDRNNELAGDDFRLWAQHSANDVRYQVRATQPVDNVQQC
jgi:hypothetical protein